MKDFIKQGRVSFILGAQFGSEGKGAAAAYAAVKLADDVVTSLGRCNVIVTTNAGVQSGHTSIHNGQKRVLFHLPTSAVVWCDMGLFAPIYLNAGSIIDPDVLRKELEETGLDRKVGVNASDPGFAGFAIHPNAAVITDECRVAEGRDDSAQTKIASTRKGVGEALARKVLRSGMVARDHPYLKQFVRRIDLNDRLQRGWSVLAEVPQGFSLGIDQPFYPHTTSRNCTVMQAMSDAGIHPTFYGASMLVVRTYPIRVGNIYDTPRNQIGHSGGAYPAQRELTWEQLGQTPEITTVTKRVRRVFEFSRTQLRDAMIAARPTHVFLSFCDYLQKIGAPHEDSFVRAICEIAKTIELAEPHIVFAYGPETDAVLPRPMARVQANADNSSF